jgi:thiosulfate/3-mercaptopyruvate sulfurtransferase
MTYETLIACEDVASQLDNPGWVIVDCRAYPADKKQGAHGDYAKAHIQGAVFASLDVDLSGKPIPGLTGRHPLPEKSSLVETFSRLGISNHSQVVVYDNQVGQMAAARLWWLLKWAGHPAVAVLDGGFQRWQALNLPVESIERQNRPVVFHAEFADELVFSADAVLKASSDPDFAIIDSRSADRYRGENETIDPIAGHIPGALSMPFSENISADGRLKSPAELHRRFEHVAGRIPAARTVFYCGSGVTATQNILSYVHAGHPMPRLYAGSWSDWITREERPVETSSRAQPPRSAS